MLRMSVELAGVLGFRVLLSRDEELDTIQEGQRHERMVTFKKGTTELGRGFNPFDPEKISLRSNTSTPPDGLDEYDKIVLRKFPGLSLKDATAAYENYVDEMRYADHLKELAKYPDGTLEEFNALSPEEQEIHWDEFHRIEAQGSDEHMYFYRVLMNKHLETHFGH